MNSVRPITSQGRLPSIPSYPLPKEDELPASRSPWTLRIERAALLVHDMQRYFIDAFTPGVAPIAPVIDNVGRLVQGCRALGVPVFYTAQNGDQDVRDRGLQAALWGPGMRHVSEHQPIAAPLAPAAQDIVLVKHRYSAFQRSNLEALLRARGRDQLIICGIYAHIGCLFTAGEAFQRDIQPFFVADAVADFSRSWHDAALAQVADCCGVVLSTRRTLEALR
ncbi:isochorismatase family protein [Pendulispora albinea]|uniref:Isochorismatase family protein n=1 Tax=Pendulispora albinea TaxID=2741071 RepID=A0ABZ2LSA3_9BACT